MRLRIANSCLSFPERFLYLTSAVTNVQECRMAPIARGGGWNRGVNLTSPYFLSHLSLLPTFWANFSLLPTFWANFSLLPTFWANFSLLPKRFLFFFSLFLPPPNFFGAISPSSLFCSSPLRESEWSSDQYFYTHHCMTKDERTRR